MKKNLKYILITIIAVLAVCFWLFMGKSSSSQPQIERELDNAIALMRNQEWSNLDKPIAEIVKLIPQLPNAQKQQEFTESCALLEMLYLAKADREEEALYLFNERFKDYKGEKIPLAHYDELLPFAKFHILNIFLKRYDMQGAFWFTTSYPAVTQGEHVEYFAAMDLFVNNKIDDSLAKLQALLEKDPDNKMIQNSIAYINRFKRSNNKKDGVNKDEK